MRPPRYPALPGEVHPAYTDKAWVIEFVETGCAFGLPMYQIRIPVFRPRWKFSDFTEREVHWPTDSTPITMERHRALGAGVYVGTPYHWEWWIGVDNLGRQVAGQARMVMEVEYP